METDTLLSEVAGRLNEKRASIEDQKEYNSVIPLPQDNSPMELEDYENREDKANDEIFQSTIPSLNWKNQI